MRRYPSYIFDLDGTLYRGSELIPGAKEAVDTLRKDGAQVRFLTNNSAITREGIADRLGKLGIEASPAECYVSGQGALAYCRQHGLNSVFVVGESGLNLTLSEGGLVLIQGEEPRADAVISGICRQFSYDLMNQAMQHLRRGAAFIATNTDATYPKENGREEPGSGSLVAAIQACSGVSPVVVGKPEPYLFNLILSESKLDARDALVVGDRFETDILGGCAAGCDTFLVLTGVSKTAPEGTLYGASLLDLLG